MNSIRFILKTIFFTLILILLIWGLWPKPLTVDIATVKKGPLTVTVDEEGRTRIIDKFIVSAPLSAVARRIELDVGDKVTANQELVELEPLPATILDPRNYALASAKIKVARAALQVAEQKAEAKLAELSFIRSNAERKKKLREQKAISEEEYESTASKLKTEEANYASALFEVQKAKSEVNTAEAELRYSGASSADVVHELLVLKSPITGEILKIFHKSEGVVEKGQPILEIGDPRHLEIEVDVLSNDAVKIKPGTKVILHRWGGDKPLDAIVKRIEPIGFTKVSALGVEEQRVLVISEITSDKSAWERLGDNYRVEASFVIWHEEDVLQVPSSSLFKQNDKWSVFIIKDGVARSTIISIGKNNGLSAEVIEGLKVGDTVIAYPDDTIDDGLKVKARKK